MAPGKQGLSDIVIVYDENGNVVHRYLHGPAVDQVFSDESAVDGLLWALSDRQRTVKDWADYDEVADSTSVYNHVVFNSYGKIKSQSNPNHKIRIGFTGRFVDPVTGFQLHGRRWYDPRTGRWLSEDPIGFGGGDVNLSRYVFNSSTNFTDPNGLDAAIIGDANDTHTFFIFDVPRPSGKLGPTIRVKVEFYGMGAGWDNTNEAVSGCPGTIQLTAWPLYGPASDITPISIPNGQPGLYINGGREEGIHVLQWMDSITEDDIWKMYRKSLNEYDPDDIETPEQSAFSVRTRGRGDFRTYRVVPPTVCTTFAHEALTVYKGSDPYNYTPIWPSGVGTTYKPTHADTIWFGYYW